MPQGCSTRCHGCEVVECSIPDSSTPPHQQARTPLNPWPRRKKCPQDSPRSGAQTPSPTYYRVCMHCINPNPLVRGQSRTASICTPFQALLTWTSGTYALHQCAAGAGQTPPVWISSFGRNRTVACIVTGRSQYFVRSVYILAFVVFLASCARSARPPADASMLAVQRRAARTLKRMRPQTTALSFFVGTPAAPITPPVALANLVTCP